MVIRGQLAHKWGATYPVEHLYDAYGQMVQLRTWRQGTNEWFGADWPSPEPAPGDTTTWVHHPATGLLQRKIHADGLGPEYTYGPGLRLATRTQARKDAASNALVTTYGHDTNTGELVSIDYSDPNTPDISHTYGRRGERVRTVDGSGTIDYGCNDALQLQTETHARSNGPHVITRIHESNGTGTVAGRLSRVRLQSPGAPAYRLDYGYDAFGRHSTFTSHHGDTQRTAPGPPSACGWIPDSHPRRHRPRRPSAHHLPLRAPRRQDTVCNWVAA